MNEHSAPDGGARANASPAARDLLLVGNPNVGKSVFFGHLTGRYVTVSNYPGTTIEVAKGTAEISGASYRVIDSPGTNQLTPSSLDERVTRDLLLDSPGAVVLQVADAKNLRRALVLTLELIEMGVPLALALNMSDEARTRGIAVNAARLAEILGVPVVETTAIRGEGLRETHAAIANARRGSASTILPPELENEVSRVADLLGSEPGRARGIALQLLSDDDELLQRLEPTVPGEMTGPIAHAVRSARTRTGGSLGVAIRRARLGRVDEILKLVFSRGTIRHGGWSERLSRWALHPIKGLFVISALLYVTLWFVGLFGAGTLVDLMENGLFGQVLNPLAIDGVDALLPFPHVHGTETVRIDLEVPLAPGHSISTGLGWERTVETSGYALTGASAEGGWQTAVRFIHDLLVGPYGIITMALSYGIAIVLPIVFTFFLLFSLLEDSGYLPRLAVMLNNFFKSMGLNGKAVLPMVLGLGCDTMATMTARIMETKKQRLIVTLLLALGVPCSAQLGVLLAMMASISALGTAIWAIVVAGSMVAVGFLAARVLPGDRGEFLLEIPPIRRPVLSNIVIKTAARLEWYLKEVVPLFILGTVVLFVLDRTHALSSLRASAAPLVVHWLGLPIETTDAFIVGFLRRDYGAVLLLQAGTGADAILTSAQTLVCMVVITLFMPCVANVFMIVREHGWKVAVAMTAFVFPFAFLVGGLLQRVVQTLHLPV